MGVEKHIMKRIYTNTYIYIVVLERLGAILAYQKQGAGELSSFLEASWSSRGAMLELLWWLVGPIGKPRGVFERLGCLGDPLEASWGSLGSLLEASWAPHGAAWAPLGAILGRSGRL